MSFHSGRVTFSRFKVSGKAPATVDEGLLEALQKHAFVESDLGRPDEIESGFITGEHLLDTQFTYEKNGFGDMLLMALRVDSNKVPADVRRAYRLINEQAMAAENPSGFASKNQKHSAKEAADHQLHEELASGKYRRSKIVPILWDLKRGLLYSPAFSDRIGEQLRLRMHETFGVQLDALTAGTLASHLLRSGGKTRDLEDLKPSPFTAPPASAMDDEDEELPRDRNVPEVPWCAGSFETKDFLGNEFLIWLWYVLETQEGLVPTRRGGDEVELAITVDRSLDMDCAWGAGGKQTLRGVGPTRMAEAGEGLRHGKWPRKTGLILAEASGGESLQWELTLQGDRMIVGSASLPAYEDGENGKTGPRELLEHRLLRLRDLSDTMDGLYLAFLDQRLGGGWSNRRTAIRKWINQRQRPAVAPALTGVAT